MNLVYANGEKLITVPAGQKIAVGVYGEGFALVKQGVGGDKNPKVFQQIDNLKNDGAVYGSFSSTRDTVVLIQADCDDVEYAVAVNPTLQRVLLSSDGQSLVSGDGTIIEIGGGGGSVAADTIWDAKGDLAGGTGANTAARLPIGADTYVLTADSAEATGMKWAAPSGGGVTVLGPYATAAALETAYPAASNSEAFATVGASAPYTLYWSDGSAWILSVARANPLVTIASSGASFTQSAVNASVLDVTLTGNCTIAFSNVPDGAYTVRLILRQDGTGSRTVTWPSGISWDGSGSAPSLRATPAAFDDIELTTVDGGTSWIARNLRAQPEANPSSYGLTHIRNDGSTTQTLTSGANSKIAAALTTVVSNADGWWDTTNKKFQPTVAGKYLITLAIQGGAASAQMVAQVWKNGAIDSNGPGYGAVTYCSGFNSQVVVMNGTTDYVEFYCVASANVTTNAAANNTYFKALFLGA